MIEFLEEILTGDRPPKREIAELPKTNTNKVPKTKIKTNNINHGFLRIKTSSQSQNFASDRGKRQLLWQFKASSQHVAFYVADGTTLPSWPASDGSCRQIWVLWVWERVPSEKGNRKLRSNFWLSKSDEIFNQKKDWNRRASEAKPAPRTISLCPTA
jgi:hypothetical protein